MVLRSSSGVGPSAPAAPAPAEVRRRGGLSRSCGARLACLTRRGRSWAPSSGPASPPPAAGGGVPAGLGGSGGGLAGRPGPGGGHRRHPGGRPRGAGWGTPAGQGCGGLVRRGRGARAPVALGGWVRGRAWMPRGGRAGRGGRVSRGTDVRRGLGFRLLGRACRVRGTGCLRRWAGVSRRRRVCGSRAAPQRREHIEAGHGAVGRLSGGPVVAAVSPAACRQPRACRDVFLRPAQRSGDADSGRLRELLRGQFRPPVTAAGPGLRRAGLPRTSRY